MNRQKKHILLWIAALLVLLCAWTVTASAVNNDITTEADGCVVDRSDPNKYVLARYEGDLTTIPASMFTKWNIKVIGAAAFYGNQNITSITLSNDIEAIYVRSFADCPNLTSVTLSRKIKLIPNEAFQDCPSLYEIVIPEGVTSIGVRAFQNCITLRRVVGPTLVKDRSNRDFWPIPSSVTTVSSDAFANCPKAVLTCFKGSAPETYAVANGIRYESIDPIVEGITVEDSEGRLAQITIIQGQTLTITPTIRPAISRSVPLAWSSGDRSIATVTENGQLTGVREGVCYVTIASEDINNISQYTGGQRIGVECSIKIVVLSSTGSPWRTNIPGEDAGKWYYRLSATSYANNFQKIGAYTFHFNKYGIMSYGWERNLRGTKKDYFFFIDPNRVVGVHGYMMTGWFEADGWNQGWYYFDADGPAHKGWLSILDEARSNKKKKIEKYIWYLLDDSTGKMKTGYQIYKKTPYYFKPSGEMADSGWILRSGTGVGSVPPVWYYATPDNGALVRGWLKLGRYWYYLDEDNCEMVRDSIRQIGPKFYYFNGSGEMQTGWAKVGPNWHYFNANGDAHVGWLQLGGVWYYFTNPYGVMVTGQQAIDGQLYFFSNEGALMQ